MADFNEVTFEDLLSTLYEGRSGTSIESTLKSFDQSGVDGPYTVYWPKSSIRVIRGRITVPLVPSHASCATIGLVG